ncbi:hypothetical protein, partial [Enterobacter cloacae complex sp. 2DZ2F2B]|uniref:hypothetical protein n=1 Tax=Enterobacter cloacae complex sp. 2DZ2F2B TaxID=2511984 RepID=UPI001CA5B408
LQESLSRKNRTRHRAVEQAFIASQRKGGNSNAATSYGSVIQLKELERLCSLLLMAVPSHLLMHFMYLGSRRISCLYLHLLDFDL